MNTHPRQTPYEIAHQAYILNQRRLQREQQILLQQQIQQQQLNPHQSVQTVTLPTQNQINRSGGSNSSVGGGGVVSVHGQTNQGNVNGVLVNRARECLVDQSTTTRETRAKLILANYQILMRYAVENELSIPVTRLYFEKVAAGKDVASPLKEWFPVSH